MTLFILSTAFHSLWIAYGINYDNFVTAVSKNYRLFLSYLPYCVKKFTNYIAVLLNPVNALMAESSEALLLTVRCFSSLLGSNPGRGIWESSSDFSLGSGVRRVLQFPQSLTTYLSKLTITQQTQNICAVSTKYLTQYLWNITENVY